MPEIIGIIPARFDAVRLPGKLLMDVGGKSVLERTWRRASAAESLDRVIIASGDEKISRASRNFGAEVVDVYDELPSGSDRIARAAMKLYPGDIKPVIVVNVQGDEPLLDPRTVDEVVERLQEDELAGVATAVAQIRSEEEYRDASVVKVTIDRFSRAIYFSRAPLPYGWKAGTPGAFRHIGLYAYRWEILSDFVSTPPCRLEQVEKLEQLRLLDNGIKITTVITEDRSVGIDTQSDLELVRQLLEIG